MDTIEQSAQRVLARVPAWIWDGASLPVPVEDIADSCFGLLVRDVQDLSAAPGVPDLEPDHQLSGLLLAARGEIWVNAAEAREWPPRRRFTIGHELGHWELHRGRADAGTVFCRSGNVDEPGTRRASEEIPARPPAEEEANAFAAALLMPAPLIRHHYKACGGDFDRLCALFDSSRAAMGRRLHAAVPRGG